MNHIESHKFEERKALMEARAKLAALVGAEDAEKIYQQALGKASGGAAVDDAGVVDALEQAYDKSVRRESLR
jgi:hypothetical protein